MRVSRSPLRAALLLVASLAVVVQLTACGGDPTPPARVEVVEVAPATVALHPGETAQLTVTTKTRTGTALSGRAVTWSSSNSAIATVSSGGLVSAVATGGAVTITAASEGASGSATVTVTAVPVARLDLSQVTLALEVGDTLRLTATPRSATGAALGDRPVTWSSADPSIVTVAPNGLMTGVAPGGPIAVTATSDGITATAQVTVAAASVQSVTVTPARDTIVIGNRRTFSAVLRDARGVTLTGRAITWSSSNPAVATVAPDGAVTALAVGTGVSITASSEGKQGSATITVINVPVASVVVTSPVTEVDEGASVTLAVQLADANGNPLTGRAIMWSSDSGHVATVDANGVVRASRAGGTRIRARVDGVEGSVALTARGLLHRWTFDEEGGVGTVFRDDIRGATGTIVRGGSLAATAIAGQVTLTGGARGNADYVALPGRIFRTLTDATIEVWATLHAYRAWARIFDIGNSTGNNLFVAWSQGISPSTDRTAFTVNGVEQRVDNALAPFTVDLQHHIVLSVDEGGGSGGKTRVTVYLDGAARGSFETTYRLRDLIDDDFWLGRSHYGDETANASYEEVRIHNRAIPASEVRQLFQRGPVRSAAPASIDVVPPAGMRDTVRGINVRFPLRAVGRDARGRRFPVAGARWSSSNPAVATIDSTGRVHATSVGNVEFSATVGTTTARWNASVVRIRRPAVDPYLATPASGAQWEVPVVLVEYLPTSDGFSIDTLKNPDFYWSNPTTLDSAEQRILDFARRRKMAVEQGSRFRGYKDAAALPSLGYRVVEHIIVYEIEPPSPRFRWVGTPGDPRFPDWFTIFADLQLEPLMRTRQVRELWIADSGFDAGYPSYKPGVHDPNDFRVNFESNMSSPTTGDISNSFRQNDDLPVLSHTYIVYGINWRRTQAEAIHNVGHQMEAMMGYVANRQDGNDRLFWRDFVGQDSQGQFITGRAGWTHMPPNTTGNYDYYNTTLVPSDIEDWRPDNAGVKKPVNLDTWGTLIYPWPGAADFGQRAESQWYTYWFQNFPGRGNRIPYGARWMTNWWAFVGNWDAAIQSGLGLHAGVQAAARGSGMGYAYAATPRSAPAPHVDRARGARAPTTRGGARR